VNGGQLGEAQAVLRSLQRLKQKKSLARYGWKANMCRAGLKRQTLQQNIMTRDRFHQVVRHSLTKHTRFLQFRLKNQLLICQV